MLTSYRGCSLTFADIGDQLWVDDVQGWFLHNIAARAKFSDVHSEGSGD
jgi:hypothetical protein